MERFETGLKKGPWTPEEDEKLVCFIRKYGFGNWTNLPKLAGLNRSLKSCRARWMNYLRPHIKRGDFSIDEERIICSLFASIGSRWSIIAAQLPGRTGYEIGKFWNTHLKKKLLDYGKWTSSHPPIQGESEGNRTNFKMIKAAEGATSYLQETGEPTPHSDVEGFQSFSFHPNIYRVPSQTIDTTSLNNAQASVYKDAESDNSESSWVSAWENNVKVLYVHNFGELQKWQGRKNFESIKEAEEAPSSFQKLEEITPNSEVEGFQSSTFHPTSNQVQLQTADMTRMRSSAEASKYEDAKSDNSQGIFSISDVDFISPIEADVPLLHLSSLPSFVVNLENNICDGIFREQEWQTNEDDSAHLSNRRLMNTVDLMQETKTSEDDYAHISSWHSDQMLYSVSADNLTSTRHQDHAAAIRIQNKFRSWKARKNFLIIRQQIVKIQAYVRGHLVRKNYKKIVWSVKILEKVILRWRRKRSGLLGFKLEALTERGSSMIDTAKEEDFDFLKECRKKKKERLQKARVPVKSMVQYPEAIDQYLFNGNTLTDNYQGKFSIFSGVDCISPSDNNKSWDANDAGLQYEPPQNHDFPSSEDVLPNCTEGVGSQPFPSSQPDNLVNIPQQGHEMLEELSTNSFGDSKEFGSNLSIQRELQGINSTQSVDVASKGKIDYTSEFTDYKLFKSKEALIQWTQEFGKKKGFEIVIKRSDLGNGGPKPRITFCCERSGQYRNTSKFKEGENKKQLRNISTKKCGCPFTLKGRKLSSDDNWMLEVVCRVHNHPITKPLEGRSYAGRLSKEETLLLIDLSKSMVRPKDILGTLKNRDANNYSNIKHIYNARRRYKKVIEMPKRSQMQQLLSKLSEYEYLKQHRSFDNTDITKDLFWAHPVSIDLLHAFPCVLLMDCTHKTSRYNLPLLEIVGVTSTNVTFVVAFVYLESEQEGNYMWALERLRNLMDDCALPTVILSDKELALMNAIEKVFPNTKHLLCRWHISMDVLTNCKNLFATNEVWEKFIMSWNVMVLSSSENELMNHLNSLRQEFSSYPKAIEYVTSTWLKNYKERFVSAWTDKIMHFGILTKNRAESSHSRLKKQLHSSQGNFETSWAKIHSLLELQHKDIRASFEKSLTVVQDQFKTSEFKELRGFVSIDALHMVLCEWKRANAIDIDVSKCGCIIRCTHGLPCAHEIAEFKRQSRPIPLESIDSYWRKLHLVPVFKKQNAKLEETEDDTKSHTPKKVTEIVKAKSTTLMEPEAKKEIRGQPNSIGFSMIPSVQVKRNRQSKGEVHRNKRLKSNTFVSSFPVGLQPYIYDIKDVVADGNCGFRAIADLMDFGENGWLQVRNDILEELKSNVEHYSQLYGTFERVKELIDALSYFKSYPEREHWMTMPDMGHLIASAYDVVLFHLSSQQCLTFLPLRSMSIPTDSHKAIAIGFVNSNHFVEVFLYPDHPVPPITSNWYKFHRCYAEGWDTLYFSRIQDFKRIIGSDVATDEIIIDSIQ